MYTDDMPGKAEAIFNIDGNSAFNGYAIYFSQRLYKFLTCLLKMHIVC